MAITSAWGGSDKSEGTLNVDQNGSNPRTYNANIKVTVWDVSLITGYRFHKQGLVYLTGFYGYYDTEGELTSNSFATEKVRGKSRSYGGLLGLSFTTDNERAFVGLEAGVTEAKWESHLDTMNMSGGLNMGFTF